MHGYNEQRGHPQMFVWMQMSPASLESYTALLEAIGDPV